MPADYLLVIDGIKGESKDKKYPGGIEIASFSWGLTNSGAHGIGSGGGTGKAHFQDMHFTMRANQVAPLLMTATASGQHIAKAVLYVRKQGGSQETYYIITLEEVLVTGFQSGGSNGDEIPFEQFSLGFAKMKFDYKEQLPNGSLAAPLSASWNQKTNSK